jgi:8-oxo-dGTP pyrophosphatase MutT (NUDIX family)
MARKDIRLIDQLAKRQTWQDPLVDAVVATVLIRQVTPHKTGLIVDDYEILVTKRLRGAEKNQHQGHHGGFLKTIDRDIYEGAIREVREEIGYELNPNHDLIYLTSLGPALYRSELSLDESRREIVLQISECEAEPNVAFVLPLFIADVSGRQPEEEVDGEVGEAIWMTARQIIKKFGNKGDHPYSQFNYFQILMPALLFLKGKWSCGQRPDTLPGEYRFKYL